MILPVLQEADLELWNLLFAEVNDDRKENMGVPKKWKTTMDAGSGSRNPVMEAERLSAEVTPAIRDVSEKVLPMEDKIEDVAAGKDAPSTHLEEGYVMCEVGGEPV